MEMISTIQNQLESLYGIGLPQRAENFLINRQAALRYLAVKDPVKIPKELLLVRNPPEGEMVEVALFLDPSLMRNLQKNNPFESLNDKNVGDFCIMIEGISHFVYFLWKAYHDTPITQLEMELQAEIDKFLMLFFYLRSDEKGRFGPEMFDLLFEGFSLPENLSSEAKGRYLTASTLASRYCYRLRKKLQASSDIKKIIEEIRLFYNLSQEQKIQHIIH